MEVIVLGWNAISRERPPRNKTLSFISRGRFVCMNPYIENGLFFVGLHAHSGPQTKEVQIVRIRKSYPLHRQ